MKLLAEIFRNEGKNNEGRVIKRNAVRGIILEHEKLLMIFSEKNGDYKFPGGGVENGENQKVALIREIREETGGEVVEIVSEFGKVIEYGIPIEPEYDVFKMTSRYYVCKIGNEFGEQKLDQYEEELGFTARWVGVEEALETNRAILRENLQNTPRWTRRETFVLDQIKTELFGK